MDRKTYDFISNIPLFRALPENEITAVAERIEKRTHPEGTILSVQGQTRIDHVYIIRSGALELYYDKNGIKTLGGMLEPGDVLGGISILMNAGICVRTVKVVQPAVLYALARDDFLQLCTRHHRFYDYFVETFSHRVLDESYASILSAGQAMDFLARVDPFTFLAREQLVQVAADLSIVQYPADTVLFVQNRSRVGHLHIVSTGAAERYYEENDRRKLQGILGEGDIYGGISMLLNNGISVRTLRTTEQTFFYLLEKSRFLSICNSHPAFSEYFTDTFGKRMLDRSYAAIIAKSLQPKDDDLQFFNQTVSGIYTRRLVSCPMTLSIQQAAAAMSRNRCSSVFIQDDAGSVIGVVTDNDLRNKVLAAGKDFQGPVSDIMTTPIKSIPAQAQVFEALMAMMQEQVKHLVVTDPDDKAVGVVTNHDLLMAQVESPVFLIREIHDAGNLEEIAHIHSRLPAMIQNMVNSGAKAGNVTGLITMLSDAVLNKIIGFTLDELGPAPVRFVFMTLGSEGRKEQTLKTDQDNAIVFEDVPESSQETVNRYFLELGNRVCAGLDRAGYAFCQGEVMAKNPRWCQPLSVWKNYFTRWVRSATPEALLHSSIFFDFRQGHGDSRLVEALHVHLENLLTGWVGFFRHLTENALHFKPPLGFFRNFVVASKGEHRDAFDIKSAMMPIVDHARIYALRHNIRETNTLERLEQLRVTGALTVEDVKELSQAYGFLMQLRFVRQATAVIEENRAPDNYINPKKLSRIEQTMLKEIFKRIEKFQVKLSFDFIGIP